MAKSKDKSEVETLRGVVKALKKQNQHLKKELSRKEKRQHLHDDLEEHEAELLVREELEERSTLLEKDRCSICQGELDIVDLKIRTLITCTSCGNRKVIKKNG